MLSGDETLFESIVFLDFFADLHDPRQAVKVIYPWAEVLLLTLCAVVAGVETFTDTPSVVNRSWVCCAGFCCSRTEQRRPIAWEQSSRQLIPRRSRSVSRPEITVTAHSSGCFSTDYCRRTILA